MNFRSQDIHARQDVTSRDCVFVNVMRDQGVRTHARAGALDHAGCEQPVAREETSSLR